MNIGLYLAGAGSLDGSDPFVSVLTYHHLQDRDWTPVPVARDVAMGQVIDHRFAHETQEERNSLTESARLVRGNVDDFRDVDTDDLSGAVLVGGGGVLSTWTDYHERGQDCRITERLKFHLMELHRDGKPIIALDNAGIAIAVAFAQQDLEPTLNPGDNVDHRDLVESTGSVLSKTEPSWDEENRIGCLPNLTREAHLPSIESRLSDAFDDFAEYLP